MKAVAVDDRLATMSHTYRSGHAAGDVEGTCRQLERTLERVAHAYDGFVLREHIAWALDDLAELVRRHGFALVDAERQRRPLLVALLGQEPLGRSAS